jgi:8-hydroxy-5-deazaflavin:NADPH oxidoreductase
MRVGIIGSGSVGQALGTGFLGRGDEVLLGSREPRKPEVQAWAARGGPRTCVGTFAEAAGFGELAVLATLWGGTENALRLAGPERLAGKVVIDVTNPLEFPPGAPPRLAVGHTDSGGEQVQRWLPEARVVKAFNIINYAYMVHPRFPGGPPDMFICGNDAAAKLTVAGVCEDFGWLVVDVGGIEGARLLEPLAMLWIIYGIRAGSWNHAFKLLRG